MLYKRSVKHDLKSIPKKTKLLIKRIIEEALAKDPLRFGVLLRKNLKGLVKWRVGDYRIIYSVNKNTVIIKIGHRKEVYKQ